MNNSHNALRNIASFRNTGKSQPISGIELMVDDKNMYFAGNDAGYVMTIDCPYGTQEMANDLLAKAQGFEYQGFTAEQVILPPETELGDGVTVAGIYGMVARRSFKFTPGMTSNIEAPRELEVQHEYKYSSPQQRKTERQIAVTRSLITKTSEEIKLEIQGVDGRVSTLQLTVQGIESQVSDAQGNISTLQQTAQSLQSQVNGKIDGNDAQTLIDQTLDTISFSVSGTNGSTTFKIKQGATTLTSETFDLHVSSVNIEGTLTADEIKGSLFYLMDDNDLPAARFSLDGASSWSGRKMMIESGAIEIDSLAGDIFLSADGVSALQLYANDYKVACLGSFVPNRNSYYDLGAGGLYWDTIYCNTSPVDLSDRNHKNSIADLPQKYVDMLSGITPRIFKLNSGKSDRLHAGFIAQEVKAQMDKHGISAAEFAGWCCDTDENGEEIQSLRYSEFIPILLAKLQQIDKRLKALEGIA